MTLCIAAICNKGEAIVAIADDKVSYQGLYICFKRKLVELGEQCNALLAGNLDLQSLIVVKVRKKIADHNAIIPYEPTTKQFAEFFTRAWQEVRDEEVERRILDHYLISPEVWRLNRQSLDPETIQTVREEINELELPGVQTIIAGVDHLTDEDIVARLYLVTGNKIEDRTDLGFVCIGDAAIHAMVEFAQSRYSPDWYITDVAEIVYRAKRRGEVDNMVGKGAVLSYLIEEESRFVTDKMYEGYDELLEKNYQRIITAEARAKLIGLLERIRYVRDCRRRSIGGTTEKQSEETTPAKQKKRSARPRRTKSE